MSVRTRQIQWWHREGEKIVCDLCPRQCRLQNGQRGFCFVRANLDGEMSLTENMVNWVLENLGEDIPLHFTAFHPDFKMMDKARTPHETLIRARDQAMELGSRHVYVGNVLDKERQSTYCPGCHQLVIERNHYDLGLFALKNGTCQFCGKRMVGVFEENCGHWGRKRLPVAIRQK